jgi:O-antigen/teichoic acid export membrane protein
MSTIRRQSIISSFVIYIGFAVGLVNTYFFTKEGLFTEAEYGLIGIFIAISALMLAFAQMAMPSYIYKFYPYYKDNLPANKNDMLSWALLTGCIGFLLVAIAGWCFKDLVIRKFGQNSPQLVQYYYWIFPMGFGLTMYTILESYAVNLGKPVLTQFLREVKWRLLTTLLIALFSFHLIGDYSLFIKLYSLAYPVLAIFLLVYLLYTGEIHFTFKPSKISRRLFRKILTFCLFLYSGTLIFNIAQVFDSLVIASVLEGGEAKVGIFTLAQLMAGVIQAPQRAIIASAIPHISRAWKEKNLPLLQKIYQRSSLNQLIFALGFFVLIALNYREAVITFQLKEVYLSGFNAFLLLGLMRVVDMGTGVNTQIIGTSNYWRFDLISGIVLLAIMLPLSYLLAKRYDITGPAIANLISVGVYNLVRIIFLWKKYKLFPFTAQTVYTLLLAGIVYGACYFVFNSLHGIGGLLLRSIAFIALYGGAVIYLRISPDIAPVLSSLGKRLRIIKK